MTAVLRVFGVLFCTLVAQVVPIVVGPVSIG